MNLCVWFTCICDRWEYVILMRNSVFDWWSECPDMLWRVGCWLHFTCWGHASFDGSAMDASWSRLAMSKLRRNMMQWNSMQHKDTASWSPHTHDRIRHKTVHTLHCSAVQCSALRYIALFPHQIVKFIRCIMCFSTRICDTCTATKDDLTLTSAMRSDGDNNRPSQNHLRQ